MLCPSLTAEGSWCAFGSTASAYHCPSSESLEAAVLPQPVQTCPCGGKGMNLTLHGKSGGSVCMRLSFRGILRVCVPHPQPTPSQDPGLQALLIMDTLLGKEQGL